MTILITGAAGFIGAAVAERLLARGEPVVGEDNLNSYYDPALKQARLKRLAAPGPRHFTSSTSPMAPPWLSCLRRCAPEP